MFVQKIRAFNVDEIDTRSRETAIFFAKIVDRPSFPRSDCKLRYNVYPCAKTRWEDLF